MGQLQTGLLAYRQESCIKMFHYKQKLAAAGVLQHPSTTTSPCTYAVEPPCTGRHARWCERSALRLREPLLDSYFIQSLQQFYACIFACPCGRVIPQADLTSPTWALPNNSMHRRLWPMPPPIVRAGCRPTASCGRAAPHRCGQPASASWRRRASASTRDAHAG